jgi:hypothetical protein
MRRSPLNLTLSRNAGGKEKGKKTINEQPEIARHLGRKTAQSTPAIPELLPPLGFRSRLSVGRVSRPVRNGCVPCYRLLPTDRADRSIQSDPRGIKLSQTVKEQRQIACVACPGASHSQEKKLILMKMAFLHLPPSRAKTLLREGGVACSRERCRDGRRRLTVCWDVCEFHCSNHYE